MRLFAFVARKGNQQLPDMLGREPTMLDWYVFQECLAEILEAEPPLLGGSAEDAERA